ncbi:MAG: T9SS type A sorting domain-containing protein [Bacteroidota bacterium]
MKNFSKARKACNKTLTSFILGFVLYFFTSLSIIQAQVKVDDEGGPFSSIADHQSWTKATNDLQAAINALSDGGGGTIWVAGGIYYPTELYSAAAGSSTTDPRNATFVIRSNVTVIGGFEGDETSPDQRLEDKFSNTNAVILSGNIDSSDSNEGNSYHVVIFPEGVGETATIQDLYITNGNANGPSAHFATRGGGVHARRGGVLKNCRIANNYAETGGGGAYLYKGGRMEDCAIYNNITNQKGGGVELNLGGEIRTSLIYSNEAGPIPETTNGFGGGLFVEAKAETPVTVTHSIIAGNYASNKGGGIGLLYGGYLINNVIANNESAGNGGGLYLQEGGTLDYNTIVANKSGDLGGGFYGNLNAELHNSTLWGNVSTSLYNQQFDRAEESTTADFCAIQGINQTTGLTNIINLEPENSGDGMHPEFRNPVTFAGLPETEDQVGEMLTSDYSIRMASALLDAGNSESSGLPVPQFDLTPNARIVKGTVDMGAFEALYYNVNASTTGGSGRIDPSGSIDRLSDEDILFTIAPESGWDVTSFMIDSDDCIDQLVDEEDQFTYTLKGISQDHDVTVEFQVASSIPHSPKEKMKVFPVPADDELFLKGVEARSFKIFDLNGRRVKGQKGNIGYAINISDLQKGMYILILEDENNESHSARFMKK